MLPYDPKTLRELNKFYIAANNDEIKNMLKQINHEKLDDLFSHIGADVKNLRELDNMSERLEYEELSKFFENSQKKII